MNCFDCDLPMVRGNYACQVDIKNSVVELENPGWWCSTCQTGVHTDEDRIILREKIDNYPKGLTCD